MWAVPIEQLDELCVFEQSGVEQTMFGAYIAL
jgi:hypothetical protein